MASVYHCTRKTATYVLARKDSRERTAKQARTIDVVLRFLFTIYGLCSPNEIDLVAALELRSELRIRLGDSFRYFATDKIQR